jgi:hypothetical protein
MTAHETGPWWKAAARRWLDPPPELPGAAPAPDVDWRRGAITILCALTCWLLGGMLLLAKGLTHGLGSWITWVGVACVAFGVAVGCGQPAGRLVLRALLLRPLAAAAVLLPMALYPLIGYWAAVVVFGAGGAFLAWRAARWAVLAVRARRAAED